ncbi:MAG TPA: hypothetical protein VJ625_00495 [Propionibacteriaceae bacterium]|nr:hypothetical protein [Propionibacteriaceae bacterium]
MDSVDLLVQSPVSDVLTLARRFEPVLRYTKGELFFPMPVERYLEAAALFRRTPEKQPPELVAPSGSLDLSTLISYTGERGGVNLELHFVDKPLSRSAYRRWRRRPDRPRFQGGSPFAMVGMFGRIIDSMMRASLIMRGKVPGGFAAAAHIRFQESGPPPPTYYVRAVRDAGYLVLQYWFFYAMNDWRSTFGGVNDHEGDWEQITLFLTEPDDSEPQLAWVAFSAHDEVGDDLRRRVDDPDLQLVDGTHPVVHAGAGSHSGAYLPGDYIVTAAPPALEKLTQWWRRFARFITPGSRTRQERSGIGLPFIDYRRGDGPSVGPGTEQGWTPVVIDDDTPWVREYRGLWGYDTRDPFGGERAPAGPRYERNGSIRRAWDRPVAWAGLDKVPPTPTDEVSALQRRAADLETELDTAQLRLADEIDQLRSRHEATRALAADGAPVAVDHAAAQAAVDATRDEIAGLMAEQQAVSEALIRPLPPEPVHAHLRHRALPDQDTQRPAHWTLRLWAAISVSVLLLAMAWLILYQTTSGLLVGLVVIIAAVAAIEAAFRGRLLPFLASLVILLLILAGIYLAVTNLRLAIAVTLIFGALALVVSNLMGYLRRR